MGVVNVDFSKIETRKKALFVRLKGIPEGVNYTIRKSVKSVINKRISI